VFDDGAGMERVKPGRSRDAAPALPAEARKLLRNLRRKTEQVETIGDDLELWLSETLAAVVLGGGGSRRGHKRARPAAAVLCSPKAAVTRVIHSSADDDPTSLALEVTFKLDLSPHPLNLLKLLAEDAEAGDTYEDGFGKWWPSADLRKQLGTLRHKEISKRALIQLIYRLRLAFAKVGLDPSLIESRGDAFRLRFLRKGRLDKRG
jgi:hypothetical protein